MRLRAIFRAANIPRVPVCNAPHCDSATRGRLLRAASLSFPAPEYEISRWRFLLRPLTLGLLCLAVSVVIWGLGYKLSLYHTHPNSPARTTVAKLWVGPRGDVSKTTANAESTSHFTLDLHSALPQYISCLRFNNDAPDSSGKYRDTRFRMLLGTLRSPPGSYL
jgi:hypothetical protein